ncbi:MAG: hypothetical protein KC910_09035 [Candidatus Eremiobacteraeota bacterium]|nr:hypothetical protein [Candidatus Eremiobacteraeota bacterium]
MPRRRVDLVWSQASEELVVFDPHRQQVHSLSATAAKVFKACDGSVLALDNAQERDAVELALAEFHNLGLLEEDPRAGLSRRTFLARWGKLAALPVITSVILPRPAAALSGCTFDCGDDPTPCAPCPDAATTCECCCNPGACDGSCFCSAGRLPDSASCATDGADFQICVDFSAAQPPSVNVDCAIARPNASQLDVTLCGGSIYTPTADEYFCCSNCS